MKKLLLSSLLIAMSIKATDNIEHAIMKSDFSRVKSYLSTISIDEETKARLAEMCNDVINKRIAKTNINHEVEETANDFKRHTRSGLLIALGAGIGVGAKALSQWMYIEARTHSELRKAERIGMIGMIIGSGIALTGLINFLQSLTLNNSKPTEKKRFIKLKNAILVKQLILKA